MDTDWPNSGRSDLPDSDRYVRSDSQMFWHAMNRLISPDPNVYGDLGDPEFERDRI